MIKDLRFKKSTPKPTLFSQKQLAVILAGIVSITTTLSIDAYFSDETRTRPLKSPLDPKKLKISDRLYDTPIPNDLLNYSPFQALSFPIQSKMSDITSTEHRKEVSVRKGDNLSTIFSRLGLSKKVLHGILALNGVENTLSDLQPGQKLLVLLNPDRTFNQLRYPLNETNTLVISYREGVFKTESLATSPVKSYKFRHGIIKTSLEDAWSEAGLSDRALLQLAEIFRWDIDFNLDIQPGDSFSIIQEELHLSGKKNREGRIVAAEFINEGVKYRAVRYLDKNGFSRFYSPQGVSLQKSFLRAPVQYTHISSHFSLARKHPILHKICAHTGVDYAAPVGTPVKAAGDGEITFLGRKGGYGNTIMIKHDGPYSTLYGHLSRFVKTIKMGERVYQGQVIGFVGSTGLTTGPHLHYEFLVNNVHRNPLTVALPNSEPIQSDEKARFAQQTGYLLAELDKYSRTILAMSEKKTQQSNGKPKS